MREKRFAEFMLRWVISSQEASAFVGDLIESGEHLNALRFWRAVSSVVVDTFGGRCSHVLLRSTARFA
jgi:hypothetical protein